MARYEFPTVFYQSSIDANTAVEVTHIKSLSWANRTNNNGNFELILPIDSELTPFFPALGGFIRLDPGDTVMQIEKRERICDTKGNRWYKLGGRPRQEDDERVRDAQNNDYFFRYKYLGTGEQYVEHRVGTPVTTVNKGDLLESSIYEDNLGGFFEEVLIDPGQERTMVDPGHPGFEGQQGIPAVPSSTWGTTVIGEPKPVIGNETRTGTTSVTIGGNATSSYGVLSPFAGYQDNYTVTRSSNIFTGTDAAPTPVSVGSASGPSGRMDIVTYTGSWIASDTTADVVVWAPNDTRWMVHTGPSSFIQFSQTGQTRIPVRTITLKSDSTYRAEMQAFLNSLSNTSGSIPGSSEMPPIPPTPYVSPTFQDAIPPTFRTTFVKGGHTGYNFAIKSKGEVEKRYKVDFNLGDTIAVNDTRLDVVYTGVVSGAVETIDGNGYSVDIEIGTLGATLEQRVQGVI
ncbi:MAG: siphovirus ReqiPepy6 Gp37-like family protein [Planctomycetaceae bacterium]|nr:siphovirus ReqiPepy6 Gp37-like family protein [Planctomycetaceae bacterium]